MKRILNPYTRLSFTFLLAVIIPGSFLTYLSVLHVKSLQELTEKSVLEERKLIIDIAIDRVQSKLNDISNNVDDILMSIDDEPKSVDQRVNDLPYTSDYFVTDEKGHFLWPNYLDPFDNIVSTNETRPIDQLINSAEIAEFQESNYHEAERLYFDLLALAPDQSDSARIINAIGRVSVKSKNQIQAVNYYKKLLAFEEQTDLNGFLYINYAFSQLLNLLTQNDDLQLVKDIIKVIYKMAEGEIPITLHAGELLNHFTEIISNRESLKNFDNSQLHVIIDKIQNQLLFVRSFGELISEKVNSGNGEVINGLYSVSNVTEGERILLIKTLELDTVYQVGCLIDKEKLLADIITGNWRTDLEFDYNIFFQNREPNPSESEGRHLSYSKVFSFPSSVNIIVELKDPNIINAYVLRTTWIYGIALVLLSGAIVLGVLLVIKDFKRERHISQLRSDFVSSVTHELKTPLTSIHMFAESIYMNRITKAKDRKEYLHIIMNETDRLKRLINNVLDFSKIEKGQIRLHLRKSDLSSLVENTLKELDYWIQEKNFKINKHITKGINANIDADAMTQAIINLLSNAMRYSGNNKEIWLRVEQNEENILIEVEDKGIGIAENHQKKVFEKFYRIDEGSTGTGLGLFVTKQIIEAHGGTISLKSKVDHGSTFTIRLKITEMV